MWCVFPAFLLDPHSKLSADLQDQQQRRLPPHRHHPAVRLHAHFLDFLILLRALRILVSARTVHPPISSLATHLPFHFFFFFKFALTHNR